MIISSSKRNSIIRFLLSAVVTFLIRGCGAATDANTSGTAEVENNVEQTEELEVKEAAEVWANSLKTRDGKPRYDMMSEENKEKFKQEQVNKSGENWNYNIGVSSPWVVDFEIEIDRMTAVITYLTQTSEPSYYNKQETVTFAKENNKLVVVDYQTLFEDQLVEK